MKVIEHDRLVADLRKIARTCKQEQSRTLGIRYWQYKAMQFLLQCLIKRLNDGTIPVVEAEPVRHGRWEPVKGKYKTITGDFAEETVSMKCSECGRELWWWDLEVWLTEQEKYCPYCGAKMDKEAE